MRQIIAKHKPSAQLTFGAMQAYKLVNQIYFKFWHAYTDRVVPFITPITRNHHPIFFVRLFTNAV